MCLTRDVFTACFSSTSGLQISVSAPLFSPHVPRDKNGSFPVKDGEKRKEPKKTWVMSVIGKKKKNPGGRRGPEPSVFPNTGQGWGGAHACLHLLRRHKIVKHETSALPDCSNYELRSERRMSHQSSRGEADAGERNLELQRKRPGQLSKRLIFISGDPPL